MNDQLKPLAQKLLTSLKRSPKERQFDVDLEPMQERLNARMDEIMKNFRSNLKVK